VPVHVDQERLVHELETLASFSDAPAPAVTRVVFSKADLESRTYIEGLFREAGLAVRKDAIGNTFARWIGAEPDLAAVGTGSHTDAVPHAGRYDGTVGVLGGLEAIRGLQRAGFRPRRSIEVLAFTSEEPTRFGIGCLGSRLLSSSLAPETAARLKDCEGRTLEEIRNAAGFCGSLADVALPQRYYHAFVELHIEQGPLLERAKIPLGIVSAIAAPATLKISVEGAGGHAGGVLMPDRHDAFLAAADIALAAEAAALATGALDSVATTGVCHVFPGAVNSIPSRTTLEIDVRDTDLARRDSIIKAIDDACTNAAENRQVQVRMDIINADAPAQSSPLVVEALRASCRDAQFEFMSMVSRAYHDSLFMSRIVAQGMLFIPCRNGYSHRPDEYASPEDMACGVQVLASTLSRLAA
jgi:ureidoglycolate amidohydrolase